MDNFFISFNQFLNGCFQEHMLQIFSIQLLFFLIQKRCRPGHRLYGVHSSSVQVKSNLKECLNYKSKRFFFYAELQGKLLSWLQVRGFFFVLCSTETDCWPRVWLMATDQFQIFTIAIYLSLNGPFFQPSALTLHLESKHLCQSGQWCSLVPETSYLLQSFTVTLRLVNLCRFLYRIDHQSGASKILNQFFLSLTFDTNL